MQKVFETSILAGNPVLLIPVPIIIVLFLFTVRLHESSKQKTRKKMMVVVVVLSLVQVWFLATQLLTYKNIVSAYKRGEYLTVSGEVQEYIPPASALNKQEQFKVDEIEFSYGGGQARNYFGYDKTALDGGAVTKAGEFVEVCYIQYDGVNVIVRLSIKK